MSLKPKSPRPMPAELARLAHLIPAGSLYRLVGDELYEQYDDEDFVDLYHAEGKPGISPVLLAFVTVFQFLENLSDRKAMEALRVRVDWKYGLHLPLEYAGFDASVLCEYRERIIAHGAEARLFERILGQLTAMGLVKRRGRQRSDSVALLTRVRQLNRLERVVETLRLALVALLAADATWTRSVAPLSWEEIYGERCVAERMTEAQRQDLEARVGVDGQWLLERLAAETTPADLRALPEVDVLATVWSQQFQVVDGQVVYQEAGPYDGKTQIQTPHDPEARYSKKGKQEWVGDKLQVTETDDEGLPHMITDVDVTSSVETDHEALDKIQGRLEARNVMPEKHYTDSGYVDEKNLVHSAARGIDLIGPVQGDRSPQSRRAGGIILAQFHLDRETSTVTCPAGHTIPVRVKKSQRLAGRFGASQCAACPLQPQCCAGKGGRSVSFGPHYEALQAARARQETEAFKEEYRRHRSPIEGSLSTLVRSHGMRVARYRRRSKRYMQALYTAAAVNLLRASRWLAGIRPQARRKGLKLTVAAV
jgi:transposase